MLTQKLNDVVVAKELIVTKQMIKKKIPTQNVLFFFFFTICKIFAFLYFFIGLGSFIFLLENKIRRQKVPGKYLFKTNEPSLDF